MAYVGVIADDFTGASDIANTLTQGVAGEGGLRTSLSIGVPHGPAVSGIDAHVVALKSRSIAADDAVAQSLAALAWLNAQGCDQVLFKYCSTFDSSPRGNIGQVAEALAQTLGVSGVVVCPAFPAAKRTVYQGHLFVGSKRLDESGMQNHPLTPMTDSDLRRWLRLQTSQEVGHVPLQTIQAGAPALRDALSEAAKQGSPLVVVDAISDADLLTIAEATSDARLVTGASGIALGVPRNVFRAGLALPHRPRMEPIDGPGAVLVGSCSRATLAQIAHHREAGHAVYSVDVDALMDGAVDLEELCSFVQSHGADAPLIYSSSPVAEVENRQNRYGRDQVAARIESMFADLARRLVQQGIRRLVVGGGETSGAVVSALEARTFEIGPEIDPGVPMLYAHEPYPIGLVLKSGNFGAPDFFSRALMLLAEGTATDHE